MESLHAQRKNEHLIIAEKTYQQTHQHHPFDEIQLIPRALPEIWYPEVNPAPDQLDFNFTWPFYIEAMTGGSQRSMGINNRLATVAHETGLAMATGSMSIIFNDEGAKPSFEIIREANPDGFIMANLGATATPLQAKQAVDLIQANALEIHVNVAQELAMRPTEGDRDFRWLDNLAAIKEAVNVPVIVKEVGFGMQVADLDLLHSIGINYVNISGRGGTNFATIEAERNRDRNYSNAFLNWGLTTPQALIEAKLRQAKSQHIIASGGVNSAADVVKAGSLGADAVGVAGHFLHTLFEHDQQTLQVEITQWQQELLDLMTLLGVKKFSDLQHAAAIYHGELKDYWEQRQ
ncbi:type 2 isopentenyl-diphosphate Delta-isomerase [Limosilactobacillus equigenerosi]|uniref:Isopentenyl-diphosphate delta-isomerase n=1 Tax=Limosilactobacillus equigenerosi DSM 18793 = JCM 14505 TaxID=1423742 RepID=A0A0R1USU4_9LACO|nr:type 2 isopentenyl-diphosphate Delta-isomerase [Limosilactobacillus equigenerosi]KRL94021.1 Isopentenyl diphosphate delta-isomerase [Limosilactobacillus equigenerosi DSM 18793 = JCM 14505]